MKAGILVEAWKLSIFERHLRSSDYSWENAGTLMPGVLLLKVEFGNDPAPLGDVVLAANTEAAQLGAPGG